MVTGWAYRAGRTGLYGRWAITQTNRFKAAMSGAGMANLACEFGTERGGGYDCRLWNNPYETMNCFF